MRLDPWGPSLVAAPSRNDTASPLCPAQRPPLPSALACRATGRVGCPAQSRRSRRRLPRRRRLRSVRQRPTGRHGTPAASPHRRPGPCVGGGMAEGLPASSLAVVRAGVPPHAALSALPAPPPPPPPPCPGAPRPHPLHLRGRRPLKGVGGGLGGPRTYRRCKIHVHERKRGVDGGRRGALCGEVEEGRAGRRRPPRAGPLLVRPAATRRRCCDSRTHKIHPQRLPDSAPAPSYSRALRSLLPSRGLGAVAVRAQRTGTSGRPPQSNPATPGGEPGGRAWTRQGGLARTCQWQGRRRRSRIGSDG